jgi:carbon starvation protein
MTASVQKVWHSDPRIGFLSQAATLNEKLPGLQQAVASSTTPQAVAAAKSALRTNRVLHFNNILDAAVAGFFLSLLSLVVCLSLREWLLLLSRRKPVQLRESPPVWLPENAFAEAPSLRVAGVAALALTLTKELSGEAQIERARSEVICECAPRHACSNTQTSAVPQRETEKQAYVRSVKERFNGVRRCC